MRYALEVTADGDTVWEFFNPTIAADGRRNPLNGVRRYSTDRIDSWLRALP